MFFRWLMKFGSIMINPAEKVVQKSVLSPLPKALTPDELQTVLEAADRHRIGEKPDTRPYALVKLLLDTAVKRRVVGIDD